MTVALLLIIIVVSTTIVRFAAFALELTGMPWDQAKFQALSAFSTTGYTTREAEQIVNHPMRRRIVSTLIVFGNAGIVTAIGTFAGTVSQEEPLDLAVNAGVLLVGLALLFALVRHEGITGRLRRRVQAWLQKRYDFQPPRPDELLRLGEGYGLTRIEIDDRSPVLGRTLAELKLNSWRVQVLAIERNGEYHPVPGGHDRLLAHDHVVVYGAEDAITKVFKPRTRTRLTIIGGENGLTDAPRDGSPSVGHAPTVMSPSAMGPDATAATPGAVPSYPPAHAMASSLIGPSRVSSPAAFAANPPTPSADPPTQSLPSPETPSTRGRYVPITK